MIIIRETKSEQLLKDLRKITLEEFKLFKGTNFGLIESKNNNDDPIVIVGYDDQNWIQLLYDVFKDGWYIVNGLDIYYDYRKYSSSKSKYQKISVDQVISSIINYMRKEHSKKPTFLDDGLELEEKCYQWLMKELAKLNNKYKNKSKTKNFSKGFIYEDGTDEYGRNYKTKIEIHHGLEGKSFEKRLGRVYEYRDLVDKNSGKINWNDPGVKHASENMNREILHKYHMWDKGVFEPGERN